MSKRHFRLEAVLELRLAARKDAEEALGLALRGRDAAAARCRLADMQLESEAAQLATGHFTAAERQHGWNALCVQQSTCQQLHLRLGEEEQRVLEQRARLIAASRDHELVSRLKDKWKSACALEEARAEERQLEEITSRMRPLNLASHGHCTRASQNYHSQRSNL